MVSVLILLLFLGSLLGVLIWLAKKKHVQFLFNRPYRSDFIFWFFIILVILQIVTATSNTLKSGGIDTSTISLVTGPIDFTLRLITAYILVVPILLIRKLLIRKKIYRDLGFKYYALRELIYKSSK